MSEQEKWIAVAIVAKPHALRGAVLLKALTRRPEELLEASLEQVYLRRRGEILRPLTIQSMALHKGVPYVFFEEITDRTGAEQIQGLELVIPDTERWELPPGEYYADDLVGCEVIEDGSGRSFGPLIRAQEGAAHDYFVFAHPDTPKKEVLLPNVPQFVLKIDLEARQVIVRLPEGLLEL